MTEQQFKAEMLRADTMRRLETDPDQQRYWEGYQRGLRRNHHGEAFGTPDEHARWSRLVHDRSPGRRRMGQGYLDGLRFGASPEAD